MKCNIFSAPTELCIAGDTHYLRQATQPVLQMADTLEIITERQKVERKTLQAKIQQLKHSTPKGDKKRKKEVQVLIAQLEAELDNKQEEELRQFKETSANEVLVVSDGVAEVNINVDDGATGRIDTNIAAGGKKKSKAQKRREKKEIADKEREERIKEQEIENLSGARHLESKKLKAILRAKGLALHEIPSDGNCLYAAIVHQLTLQSQEQTVGTLRKQAASYIRANADDFLPFLCKPDTGDPYTQEEFNTYCSELETTPAWGGQLEIRALSSVLQRPLEVIQADTPSVISGEEYKTQPLVLPYFRHAFGLGEHYNSVRPLTAEDHDEGAEN